MPNAQPTPYLPPGQTGGVGPGGIQQGGMQMQQVLNPAAATNAYLSGGAFLDPGSNPYVQNAVQAATAPIFQDLAQRTLPAQQATAAAGAGANFGGSREGTQEAQDVLNAYRTAGQTGAGIMNTALGQGLQATGQAIGQAPGTAESLLAPGAAAEAVGGEQQTQLQNFINAQNQSQMFQQLLPLLKGQLMAQGAGALPGGGTTTTGTGTSSPSPLSTALGIGSTAGGLMSGIGALAAAGLLV